MLGAGWVLLQVVPTNDEFGSYPCYVLGKPRAENRREWTPHSAGAPR